MSPMSGDVALGDPIVRRMVLALSAPVICFLEPGWLVINHKWLRVDLVVTMMRMVTRKLNELIKQYIHCVAW